MNNTILRANFEYKFSLLTFYARTFGISFITTSFFRTAEEQNRRFKEGKSRADGYKKISKHQLGRAKDVVIIDSEGNPIWEHTPEYDTLGRLWEQMGGIWGGRWFKEGKTPFDDCYHFEDGEKA